jgi:fructose-1,6-bisphosphatase I
LAGTFIIEKQADFLNSKGELLMLLCNIGVAEKIVNREVNRAGLIDNPRPAFVIEQEGARTVAEYERILALNVNALQR